MREFLSDLSVRRQIGAMENFGPRLQFLGRSFEDELTAFHYVGAAGERERERG